MHTGHDVVPIEETNSYLKDILVKCAGALEERALKLGEAPEKLCESLEKERRQVEQAKESIRACFTEAREALDAKEIDMLRQLENVSSGPGGIDELSEELQSFEGTSSSIISSAKELLSQWESTPLTAEKASNVISISRAAKNAEELEKKYIVKKSHEILIDTEELKEETKKIMATVGGLKFSTRKIDIYACPENLVVNRIGASIATLSWDRTALDSEYCVREIDEGDDEEEEVEEEDDNEEWEGTVAYSGPDNWCTACWLDSDTEYSFRVRAKRDGVWSKWSKPVTITTKTLSFEEAVNDLKEAIGSSKACASICELLIYALGINNLITVYPLYFLYSLIRV